MITMSLRHSTCSILELLENTPKAHRSLKSGNAQPNESDDELLTMLLAAQMEGALFVHHLKREQHGELCQDADVQHNPHREYVVPTVEERGVVGCRVTNSKIAVHDKDEIPAASNGHRCTAGCEGWAFT